LTIVLRKKLQQQALHLIQPNVSSPAEIRFLGQLVDSQGIRSKFKAVQQMKETKNIPELCRFLGMINQLGKFTPNLAENTKPLHNLFSTKNQWILGNAQQEANSYKPGKFKLCTNLACLLLAGKPA